MHIGLLGGTFNPVHNAHMQMARIARDEAALNRVLLMVAGDPPHKPVDEDVSAADRFRFVQIAAAGEDRIVPDDQEIQRGGKSYTVLTLQELRKKYPGAQISIILGSDTLADLPNWYRPDEVLQLADVLCVPRIGRNENDEETARQISERFGAKIRILSAKADMISSTEIRKKLLAGQPVDGLMPEAVEQAVYESGIYFPAELRAMQEKSRAELSPKRYRHVCGTMRAAAKLAVLWGQDAEKARIAALLHDCAKCLDPKIQELLSGDESGIAPVHHAFAGAVVAKMQYGVTDEEILRAIRLHTTGDRGMTTFDALIYAADLIEPMRSFPCVEDYRSRVSDDIDTFMHYSLSRVSRMIEKKSWNQHPASTRAIAWYDEKIRARRA